MRAKLNLQFLFCNAGSHVLSLNELPHLTPLMMGLNPCWQGTDWAEWGTRGDLTFRRTPQERMDFNLILAYPYIWIVGHDQEISTQHRFYKETPPPTNKIILSQILLKQEKNLNFSNCTDQQFPNLDEFYQNWMMI